MGHLFEITSKSVDGADPIPAGATMNISECMIEDCRPMSLTVGAEACRSFTVLQVHAARQPLPIKWNQQQDKLTWADSPPPQLLAGQDFWVTVRNDSKDAAHFDGEVRGRRERLAPV